ncbi:MAG: bifunctional diaminohydroxyphosphoribosylaminopyrimidine deaminase/5-amino-6-(5-phosphoribosylamino)uracil reductase RibD [bacterium]
MTDEQLISRAVKLAEKGRGAVSPNPLVGAVIVKKGVIIGEGFHKEFGKEHAEVVALNSVSCDAAGATLYVNLEPCSHQGKQPPCTERIVAAGIKKVVIGMPDPNELVNGKGIAFLKKQGVAVVSGVNQSVCEKLNEGYTKFVSTGFPLTTLKIAQTLDGKIAASNGRSKWITAEPARRYVHKLRSRHDAILVGVGTVLADDPRLTVRHAPGVNPVRIVVDSQLSIPLDSKLLRDTRIARTVIASTTFASPEKAKRIADTGASVWRVNANSEKRVDLTSLWTKLGQEGITSVFVEGGSEIFTSMLKSNLADRIHFFVAPKILGDGLNPFGHLGIENLDYSLALTTLQTRHLGQDILITADILTTSN